VEVEFANYGYGSVWFDDAVLTAVPEPATAALLALGLGGIFLRCRRFSR
jgi:hypothetical protein